MSDSRGALFERVLLLRALPQFADLDPAHLATMAEVAEDRFFPAGAEIRPQGARVMHIHYLIHGQVELRRDGRVIRVLGEGSVVGGLAALARVRDAVQVVARTDVTTFAFSQESQHDVFEEDFEVLSRIVRNVARGLIAARQAAGGDGGFAPGDEIPPHPRAPLSLVDKLTFLRRTGPYDAARLEAVAELAGESPEVRLGSGQVLWRTGDSSGSSLVIVAGVVAGSADRGRQRFRFSTGRIVGGLDSLAAMPRWYDATAATDVVAIQVNHGVLLDLLEDDTEMAIHLLRALASGLVALRERPVTGDCAV